MTKKNDITEILAQVERYVMPLTGNESGSGLSKEENQILALQGVNRLNQWIGRLARGGSSSEAGEMRILQTFVNRLTLGIKSDNPQQMRGALLSIKNLISSIAEKGEEKEEQEKEKK